MDAKKISDQAAGNVSQSLLEGTGSGGILSPGYFTDGPLVDHLHDGEQVDYALKNFTKGVDITGRRTNKIIPGDKYRTVLLVTDSRLLYVIGQNNGDKSISLQFSEVSDVDISVGFLKDRFTVHTDLNTYDMYVRKGSDIEDVEKYVTAAATSSSESKTTLSETEVENRSSTDDRLIRMEEMTNKNNPKSDRSTQEPPETEPNENDGPDVATGNESSETAPQSMIAKEILKSSTKTKATLEVLVANERGEPVSNATVSLIGSGFDIDGQTSQNGRYSFELSDSVEVVKLQIDHPTYNLMQTSVAVADGAVIDVTLETTSDTGEDNYASDAADTTGPDCTESDENPSREELLAELVSLNRKMSRKVTRGRMRSRGKYEPEDYETEFGLWSTALEEAQFSEEESETESTQQDTDTKDEIVDSKQSSEKETKDTENHETEFEWVEATDPLDKPISEVSDGRLPTITVVVKNEMEIDRSKRDAVFNVETTFGDRVEFTIWKKHDIDFAVNPGDMIQLNQSRLQRWETDNGYGHQLSSTKDLRITPIDTVNEGKESEENTDSDNEKKKERLIGVGGATESDAEALIESGYTSTQDLQQASLEELRSISGLNDGTALRMKAEFG